MSVFFKGNEYKFKLFKEKRKGYIKPYYLADEIPFFWTEFPGYIKRRDIKEGDYVLDLGAYHGAFSIYADKKVGKFGKVFAFEPEENNIKILKENLKLNKCKHVIPIQKGIWSRNAKLHFSGTGPGACINKTGEKIVKVTSIDSELKKRKIPFEKISFIKIDVEGAEIEALKGMKELLKKGKPFLAIASYHIVDGKKSYKKVEKILKDLGYNVKTCYPKHLTTFAWKAE